jgi:hypothetical protein
MGWVDGFLADSEVVNHSVFSYVVSDHAPA